MANWDFLGSIEKGFSIGDRMAQRRRQGKQDEAAAAQTALENERKDEDQFQAFSKAEDAAEQFDIKNESDAAAEAEKKRQFGEQMAFKSKELESLDAYRKRQPDVREADRTQEIRLALSELEGQELSPEGEAYKARLMGALQTGVNRPGGALVKGEDGGGFSKTGAGIGATTLGLAGLRMGGVVPGAIGAGVGAIGGGLAPGILKRMAAGRAAPASVPKTGSSSKEDEERKARLRAKGLK